MLTQVVFALPHRFSRMVAIDGLPGNRSAPDISEHERSLRIADEISSWLDHRRKAAGLVRKPGTPDELAERRARMNPRLSQAWLRYIVSTGARLDEDGWRWKLDPSLRMGGVGPWRAEWAINRMEDLAMPGFPIPLLGLIGTESEPMGWGVTAETLRQRLPAHSRVEEITDTGHFIHIEKPEETAALVLDFLRS